MDEPGSERQGQVEVYITVIALSPAWGGDWRPSQVPAINGAKDNAQIYDIKAEIRASHRSVSHRTRVPTHVGNLCDEERVGGRPSQLSVDELD
ncbi:hypothetical protein N7539_008924 [Penicillium diatomitis]|uniref:Uncharacterized protein n=1 Tax=Penicillium diatomitis TaxID=2819901 RepID=A0A9W9WKS7_9EURO|nr:uncharacterized protein N7539_008924 [Penicillium diatomitis]KAJ5469306.1 hypothetical protein N7539_008924 [Penicillium diatomitis]